MLSSNSQTKSKAIVLAAGQGSRMKGATPKVLTDLAGIPLVARVCITIAKSGFEQITVVVNESDSGAMIRELLQSFPAVQKALTTHNCKLSFAIQKVADGTGGAVRAAIEQNQDLNCGEILICAGDAALISSNTLKLFLEDHLDSKATLSVLNRNSSRCG